MSSPDRVRPAPSSGNPWERVLTAVWAAAAIGTPLLLFVGAVLADGAGGAAAVCFAATGLLVLLGAVAALLQVAVRAVRWTPPGG